MSLMSSLSALEPLASRSLAPYRQVFRGWLWSAKRASEAASAQIESPTTSVRWGPLSATTLRRRPFK